MATFTPPFPVDLANDFLLAHALFATPTQFSKFRIRPTKWRTSRIASCETQNLTLVLLPKRLILYLLSPESNSQ